MTGLERIVAHVAAQRGRPGGGRPLVCGASRRVYGCTYAEWAQDGELMAKSMIQATELIQPDGVLTLVDLSVEAADFGQEVIYPIEDTPPSQLRQSFYQNTG